MESRTAKKKHHMPEKIRNEEDVYMRNSRHTMKRTDIRNVKKRRRKKRELRVARAERQTFDNVVVLPFGRYCKLQIKRKRRGKKYNRNKFVFSAFVFFFNFRLYAVTHTSVHIAASMRSNDENIVKRSLLILENEDSCHYFFFFPSR